MNLLRMLSLLPATCYHFIWILTTNNTNMLSSTYSLPTSGQAGHLSALVSMEGWIYVTCIMLV